MAKKSKIAKNKKIEKIRTKYFKLAAEYRAARKDKSLSYEERAAVTEKMLKLPHKALGNQHRNRCEITGRPRGVYRKYRLCRQEIRKHAALGYIPGLRKSS